MTQRELRTIEARGKEDAKRILYKTALSAQIGRGGVEAGMESVMEASFYLSHGRFSPVRRKYPLTRVLFKMSA